MFHIKYKSNLIYKYDPYFFGSRGLVDRRAAWVQGNSQNAKRN